MEVLPEVLRNRVMEMPSGCWEWQAYCNPAGYGQVRIDSVLHLVHRYVFQYIHGAVESELVIMHTCDNPACCNPGHLALATQKQNVQDAVHKGRMNSGEANGMAKFSVADVLSIRQDYEAGKSQSAIAREWGVNRSAIWKIVHKQHWSKI